MTPIFRWLYQHGIHPIFLFLIWPSFAALGYIIGKAWQ